MEKPETHTQYTRRWRYAQDLKKTAEALGYEAYAEGTKCRVIGLILINNHLTPCAYTFEQDGDQIETVRHLAKQGTRKRLERNPVTDLDLRKRDVFKLWALGETFRPMPEEV